MSEPAAEAELEAFREQWRAEVEARSQQGPTTSKSTKQPRRQRTRDDATSPTVHNPQITQLAHTGNEELEAKSYHDLPDKEEQLQLSVTGQNHDRETDKEPTSALEHYERAVEKESQGQLGDSLKHYRIAFKMDDSVHELYKKKHFPNQGKQKQPSAAPRQTAPAETVPKTTQDLLKSFAALTIQAPPPPTDASPTQRSRLGELPEEILIQILGYAAMSEVQTMPKLASVCKRLAYLTMTEDTIWRDVALESDWGFKHMLYRFACDVDGHELKLIQEAGFSLDDFDDELDEARLFAHTRSAEYTLAWTSLAHQLVKSTYADSWRQMFKSRPRIRFNGCYISTVNYTRPGGNNTNTLSWGVPVHVVTYFRYLRFFRDGTVISLLTTNEPADVVHHLTKDNLHHNHGNVLPSAVMKTALRGRWRLTGPLSGLATEDADAEQEGEVLVETQGSTSRYDFVMRLAFGNAGKGARNNKLAWRSYESRNKLTDDSAQFTLKHDKGFYWSRVRSYT